MTDTKNACWVFDFTISRDANPDLSWCSLKSFLQKISKLWGFQSEEGITTGYRHFQGRLKLINKKRKLTLYNTFKDANITIALDAISITSQTNAKIENFYNYITKEDTRVEGPWTDKDEASYIPIQYRGKMETLRPWQQSVVDSIKSHNDRKINWIFDNKGNNGKSTCAHLCRLHLKGVVLPIVNDSEKLIQSCCNILKTKRVRNRVPIFIDLPRAMDQEKLGGFITAIEYIMSGHVYDVRNRYDEWDFDTPSIWIFSNTHPDTGTLTADRWSVWGISTDQQLIELKCGMDECYLD